MSKTVAKPALSSVPQLQWLYDSPWHKFFGHMFVWDSCFNKTLYPLGEDDGAEAEEFSFCEGEDVFGREALREFTRMKRQPASLWAQGRYIRANPLDATRREHPLVGIGAQWKDRLGYICFPVFDWYDGKPRVYINSHNDKFSSRHRFLLRKETGI